MSCSLRVDVETISARGPQRNRYSANGENQPVNDEKKLTRMG
jgi:hypothetical protein